MKKLLISLYAVLLTSGLLTAIVMAQATSVIKNGESPMLKQYAFFYLMKPNSSKVPELIPEHARYWKRNNPIDYCGGPFSDQSGGLIQFKVENIKIATDLVNNDPFITGGVIEKKWVKEWIQK